MREIIWGAADGAGLKSDSEMDQVLNGILRFTSGLTTPESVAMWAAGAGIAGAFGGWARNLGPQAADKLARYPIVAKGLDIVARNAVSGYFAATQIPAGGKELYQGIKAGSPEQIAGGAASLLMGGMAGIHALGGASESSESFAKRPKVDPIDRANAEAVGGIASPVRPTPEVAERRAQQLEQQGRPLAAASWRAAANGDDSGVGAKVLWLRATGPEITRTAIQQTLTSAKAEVSRLQPRGEPSAIAAAQTEVNRLSAALDQMRDNEPARQTQADFLARAQVELATAQQQGDADAVAKAQKQISAYSRGLSQVPPTDAGRGAAVQALAAARDQLAAVRQGGDPVALANAQANVDRLNNAMGQVNDATPSRDAGPVTVMGPIGPRDPRAGGMMYAFNPQGDLVFRGTEDAYQQWLRQNLDTSRYPVYQGGVAPGGPTSYGTAAGEFAGRGTAGLTPPAQELVVDRGRYQNPVDAQLDDVRGLLAKAQAKLDAARGGNDPAVVTRAEYEVNRLRNRLQQINVDDLHQRLDPSLAQKGIVQAQEDLKQAQAGKDPQAIAAAQAHLAGLQKRASAAPVAEPDTALLDDLADLQKKREAGRRALAKAQREGNYQGIQEAQALDNTYRQAMESRIAQAAGMLAGQPSPATSQDEIKGAKRVPGTPTGDERATEAGGVPAAQPAPPGEERATEAGGTPAAAPGEQQPAATTPPVPPVPQNQQAPEEKPAATTPPGSPSEPPRTPLAIYQEQLANLRERNPGVDDQALNEHMSTREVGDMLPRPGDQKLIADAIGKSLDETAQMPWHEVLATPPTPAVPNDTGLTPEQIRQAAQEIGGTPVGPLPPITAGNEPGTIAPAPNENAAESTNPEETAGIIRPEVLPPITTPAGSPDEPVKPEAPLEEEQPKHELASTQANLSGPVADQVRAVGALIPADQLAKDGDGAAAAHHGALRPPCRQSGPGAGAAEGSAAHHRHAGQRLHFPGGQYRLIPRGRRRLRRPQSRCGLAGLAPDQRAIAAVAAYE